MRSFRGDGNNKNLDYLADLARASGDDLATALQLGLQAMPDPADRVQAVLRIIESMPPEVRVRALAASIPSMEDIRAAAETYGLNTRRTAIVRDLIAVGRERRHIDFSLIPPDTTVDINLHVRDGAPSVPQLVAALPNPARYPMIVTSLGDGMFETEHHVYGFTQNLTHLSVPANALIRLCGIDAAGEYVPTVRYGKPLAIATDDRGWEVMGLLENGSGQNPDRSRPYFVGQIQLDDAKVFA